jgi:hypothetical protein
MSLRALREQTYPCFPKEGIREITKRLTRENKLSYVFITISEFQWLKTNVISPSLQVCVVLQDSCPLRGDSEPQAALVLWNLSSQHEAYKFAPAGEVRDWRSSQGIFTALSQEVTHVT